MDERGLIKSLWLNSVCGHSPALLGKCLKLGTAESLFDGAALDGSPIDKKSLKKLLGHAYTDYKKKDLSEAEKIFEQCAKGGIRIMHISDPEYPNMLKNTNSPPHILYAKGENINLNRYLTVSVVGTRYASAAGIEFAKRLCYDMAKSGVVVVSGMARRIDSAAHLGALNAGQITVAVLAGGVDIVYPPENDELYRRILECGMIVSERPPGWEGKGDYYQERNRIIAGLSYGSVVVEGPKRSGTSITIKYAQEYNRDIFAVPGKPTDKNAYIPNNLIKDGAITTLSAEDVVGEYSAYYGELLDNGIADLRAEQAFDDEPSAAEQKPSRDRNLKRKNSAHKQKAKPDLNSCSPKERKILEYICKFDKSVHIDDIIRETGLSSSDVSSVLVMLQLKGFVAQSAGNLYSLA